MSMKHINVYGPQASGKTRNAKKLQVKYQCGHVVDEGREWPNEDLLAVANAIGERTLILSIEKVRGTTQIPIDVALRGLA